MAFEEDRLTMLASTFLWVITVVVELLLGKCRRVLVQGVSNIFALKKKKKKSKAKSEDHQTKAVLFTYDNMHSLFVDVFCLPGVGS